ncbi:glycoside hydrolase domain-containing protein [Bradyrhizobium viridifuturi]|nr:glycoside hydrolase domain-containing protein [Bradyrhizobium viridifuturi]
MRRSTEGPSTLTRRDALLGCLAVSAFGHRATAATSAAAKLQLPAIADSSEDVTRALPAIKQSGVKAIVRYYAAGYQPSLPTKRITKPEADAILGAGLALGIAYQYNNSSLQTFTAERGRTDALFSLDEAGRIGQPARTTVYFGVDGDWPDARSVAKVLSYFEAVNDAFRQRGTLHVGVYGSGKICNELGQRGLATQFWLPGSTGWADTRSFYNNAGWTLYQHALELPCGNVALDVNLVRADAASLGFFDRSGPWIAADDLTRINQSRMFVEQPGAGLFAQPSAGSDVLKSLRRGSTVTVLESKSSWVRVAATEGRDGSGFCHAGQLAPINRMP